MKELTKKQKKIARKLKKNGSEINYVDSNGNVFNHVLTTKDRALIKRSKRKIKETFKSIDVKVITESLRKGKSFAEEKQYLLFANIDAQEKGKSVKLSRQEKSEVLLGQ